jgi:hypothetical protein
VVDEDTGVFIRHENGADIGRQRQIKFANLSEATSTDDPAVALAAAASEPAATPEAPAVSIVSAIQIDANQPWANWPIPESVTADIRKVVADADGGVVTLYVPQEEGEDPITIGIPSSNAMKQLGLYAQFPVDFVSQLRAPLRAQILTERLASAEYHGFNFIRDSSNNTLTNLAPDWRQTLPYSVAAQFVYDQLCELNGNIEVDEANVSGGTMMARFFTPVEAPITRKLGDVLQYGLQLRHDYGTHIEIGVYAKRLVCLNGMTANSEKFKWSHRTMGTADNQLAFLANGVQSCKLAFDQMVNRSIQMSETTFEGDGHAVLEERARSLGISSRLNSKLFDAFDQEPGDTEWHLVNALTRVATHDADINAAQRDRIMELAGEYTRQFEMVDAHLPAAIARKVGASIITRETAIA